MSFAAKTKQISVLLLEVIISSGKISSNNHLIIFQTEELEDKNG